MLNSLAFVREKHLFHRNPSCWCVANHFQLLSFRTHPLLPLDNKMPKKNLTIDEVNALISELIDNSSVSDEGRVLARGAVRDSADKFKISRMQVYRYWKQACDHREKHGTYLFATPLKNAKSGRNPIYDTDEIDAALVDVPLESRSCLRDIADGLSLPLTMV